MFTLEQAIKALDWVGGQSHASAALSPERKHYPLYRSLGGRQGKSGAGRNNLTYTGIRSPDLSARSE